MSRDANYRQRKNEETTKSVKRRKGDLARFLKRCMRGKKRTMHVLKVNISIGIKKKRNEERRRGEEMSARDVPMYQARQLTQGGEEIGRSEDSAGGGGLSNDPRVRVSTCSARLCTTRTNTVYSWAPGFEIAFVPRGTRTRGSRAVTARACHSLSRQSISFNSAFRARSDRSGGENRPGSRGTERTKEREEEEKENRGKTRFFRVSRGET